MVYPDLSVNKDAVVWGLGLLCDILENIVKEVTQADMQEDSFWLQYMFPSVKVNCHEIWPNFNSWLQSALKYKSKDPKLHKCQETLLLDCVWPIPRSGKSLRLNSGILTYSIANSNRCRHKEDCQSCLKS